MNSLKENFTSAECNAARSRLYSVRGDPFLFADWEQVLFLHFATAPDVLHPHVPQPLKLDLHEGNAYVTLVAVTMRHFRPARPFSMAWALCPISCQRFLNVRTYVHNKDEPGALFLWGWLSNVVPFPTFGLPCACARMQYQHDDRAGQLWGEIRATGGQFKYHAAISPQGTLERSAPGSLAEFALERYTGFFSHGNRTKIFRAWHPTWLQTSVDVSILEDALLTNKFSWFKKAEFVGANFAPGFKQVSLGNVHSLQKANRQKSVRRHGASGFYEMP